MNPLAILTLYIGNCAAIGETETPHTLSIAHTEIIKLYCIVCFMAFFFVCANLLIHTVYFGILGYGHFGDTHRFLMLTQGTREIIRTLAHTRLYANTIILAGWITSWLTWWHFQIHRITYNPISLNAHQFQSGFAIRECIIGETCDFTLIIFTGILNIWWQ